MPPANPRFRAAPTPLTLDAWERLTPDQRAFLVCAAHLSAFGASMPRLLGVALCLPEVEARVTIQRSVRKAALRG